MKRGWAEGVRPRGGRPGGGNGVGNGVGKSVGKSSLPWWLLGLGLVAMGIAFNHRDVGATADAMVADLQFDLGSLDAPGAGNPGLTVGSGLPYSASRRSNRAFALLHLGDGRFYALYGPPAATDQAAPALAGVLVGHGDDADGVFSSDDLREFSIETGALRIAAQPGRFVPARFIEGDTVHADGTDTTLPGHTAAAGLAAGEYRGRLADLAGSSEARLTVGDDGEWVLNSRQGCTAQGTARPRPAAAVWDIEARFAAGCAHDGETLHGHALLRHGELYVVLPSDEGDGGALFSGRAPAAPQSPVARR